MYGWTTMVIYALNNVLKNTVFDDFHVALKNAF